MRVIRLSTTFALLILGAACASQASVAPQPVRNASASGALTNPTQVPLLYVVDGIRYPVEQVPEIYEADVASVRVLKGRAALLKYGPEASYGVVLVTTKRLAVSP
ncbi:MAG: hypothetical protein H7Z41_11700 [Cytophagales bacterium]|nr:hypothetical protein [Armatimonadota bacterium]